MNNISIFNFAAEKIKYIFNNNEKFRKWGSDNEQPLHYLDFYEEVPEHASAINFILTNLIKDGIETLDYWTVQKLALDYLIFGGFACEVIKTRNGGSTITYIDISKLRLNPAKTQLGYSENWSNYKVNVKWKDITESMNKEGIYWFKNPKSRYDYPTPHYFAASKALDTMEEISEYHNNNAKHGFTPNVIINFNNGEPDEETKKALEKKMEEKFSGGQGKKFLLSFNESTESATTIDKLDNDNLDQKFETLQKFLQNQIIIAHQITSGQLIGVRADNQGFSKSEYEESLDIFKTVIISGYKRELEAAFSKLFGKEITINMEG